MVALFIFLSFSSYAQERSMCRLFLTTSVLKIYEKPAKKFLILKSPKDIQAFLKSNPKSVWKNELLGVSQNLFQKNIIFISEYGPTLWTEDEYTQWKELSHSVADVDAARESIMSMSRGEVVNGFSKDIHTRLRNSFLAYMEGVRSQNVDTRIALATQSHTDQAPSEQLAVRRYLTGNEVRHPHLERQAKFFDQITGIDQPKDPWRYLNFIFESSSEAMQIARDRRSLTPSLRLPFKFTVESIQKSRTIEGAQTLENDWDVERIMKMLLDTSLVRRLLVQGQRLDSLLESDDQLYFLSAFSELLPFWRETAPWAQAIRNQELNEIDVYFSPPLLIYKNEQGQNLLSLVLGRTFDGKVSVDLELHFVTEEGIENYFDDSDRIRFRAFVQIQTKKFNQIFGRRPQMFKENFSSDKMSLESKNPKDAAALIAFFMYLKQKFEVTSFDSFF